MTLADVMRTAIEPALALLPAKLDSPPARVMLLAIGQQESRFTDRVQKGGGPAHSFWQFEAGGGVKGVMNHAASQALARALCAQRGVPFERRAVWQAMASDDVLGAGLARLLLWTDPLALPARGDAQGGWDLYERVWRPGKPHRDTWDGFYAKAVQQVYGRV
jgi:hypothetical protein